MMANLGKRVSAITTLALLLFVSGCSSNKPRHGYGWSVQQDPNGLGYWAGPSGGRQRFYPSAYSNPAVNSAGGPAR